MEGGEGGRKRGGGGGGQTKRMIDGWTVRRTGRQTDIPRVCEKDIKLMILKKKHSGPQAIN